MKLVTIESSSGDSPGVVTDHKEILDLSRSREIVPAAHDVPPSIRGILEEGDAGLDMVRACLDGVAKKRKELLNAHALIAFGEADLGPPVPNPRLILSAGMNYGKHLEEMKGTPVPDVPTAFIMTRDALLGSGKPIQTPPQSPDMVDYEGELCAVIGQTCHNIEIDEAMDCVAGYTILNDVSARDWVPEIFKAEGRFDIIHAWERNIHGKQLPNFAPCGPVMITKDEIIDPHDLQMETRLNGQVMQSTSTNDLIFKIPKLISFFSQWYRFHPGDIITTGSPAGVGFGHDPQIFMKPGDLVEVEIEGIGLLSNTIA